MGIDSISFERLLSHSANGRMCLRDIVFEYYRVNLRQTCLADTAEAQANVSTKQHLDALYATFVTRQT